MDPAKVLKARLDAGLSLGDIAGDEVSRTQIYFVEHGRSRPSRRVLELIAVRTGKPVSYFLAPGAERPRSKVDQKLSRQLSDAAKRVRSFAAARALSRSEREAMNLVEVTLNQAAALIRALELKNAG